MPGRRLAPALLVVAALAVGCSGTDDRATSPTTARARTTSTITTSTAPSTTTTSTTTSTTVEPATTASTPSTAPPPTTVRTTVPVAPAPAPAVTAPAPAPAPGSGSLRGIVIVVDPGHNGANGSHTTEINRPVDAGGFTKPCNTTGTAGGSYAESTFTWEVAQRLAPALTALGATVVLTRTDNTGWGPCVDVRGRTAVDHHADLLLSIHADGAAASGHGFHVIHPTPLAGYTAASASASAALAARLRDALVAQGFTPSTYLGRDGLDERGDLGTLNRAEVPAVMLEAGNMRNSADLATLKSADGQARIVDAMVAATTGFVTGR